MSPVYFHEYTLDPFLNSPWNHMFTFSIDLDHSIFVRWPVHETKG